MVKRQILTLVLLLIEFATFANLVPKIISVPLGDSKVDLFVYENNYVSGGMCFVHVHENETASLAAGLNYIELHGGRLITLKHSFDNTVNRNAKFKYKSKKYEFDPNRIFSSDINVLRKTLKSDESQKLNYNIALAQVDQLAKIIWNELKNSSYLISLHNNKNKCASCDRKGWFGRQLIDESYNITSYVQKCDVQSESNQSCDDIYINPKINNSEFFIVTEKKDFEYFYLKRFNVVLQNQHPIDDGSMSVFAVLNKMRYINAEAKHGRVEEQSEMLSLIVGLN
jgi:hypothetical protein